MKKMKKTVLRQGMSAIMSAALLLTAMPMTAAGSSETYDPVMDGILADAIHERNATNTAGHGDRR